MRGKRAKHLRRMAAAYVKYHLKEPIGKDFNVYNQAHNRYEMMPALDEDGIQLRDPDGEPLVAPKKMPGTIHCAWSFRIVYQKLKVETRGRKLG